MISRPTIHCFRQDLRLTDNASLSAAVEAGPVILVYVLDDQLAGDWTMGGASRWWLHGSLLALQASVKKLGSRLLLRRGETVEVLLRLAAETGAGAIHVTRGYEPFAVALETQLKAACDREGIALRRYPGCLLTEPEAMRSQAGAPFRVFTPFWRSLRMNATRRAPIRAPVGLPGPSKWPASEVLDDWSLTPSRPDWAGGLRATWIPGEAGAAQRLSELIDGALAGYGAARDRPDQHGTSMLSPHLHFGEVSPNQCWQAVQMAAERDPASAAGAEAFLRELAWREFSYHLLHKWPSIVDSPFRPEFANFVWDRDADRASARFDAWSRGQTGYPIVDAGMRQLRETGWMHNRVRMITASFLTKHLLVPWQSGARWFWDNLVDADLASNSASWQWVAGSGAEAAPFFRIFNPILQGEKFDPDGVYVRKYVPELAGMPNAYIHSPWTAPASVLAAAGARLGDTYPPPIVDHATARQAAMAVYGAMKHGNSG